MQVPQIGSKLLLNTSDSGSLTSYFWLWELKRIFVSVSGRNQLVPVTLDIRNEGDRVLLLVSICTITDVFHNILGRRVLSILRKLLCLGCPEFSLAQLFFRRCRKVRQQIVLGDIKSLFLLNSHHCLKTCVCKGFGCHASYKEICRCCTQR